MGVISQESRSWLEPRKCKKMHKYMGPSRLYGDTGDKNAKIPRWTGGPGPPGSPKIGIFGPKTPGDPSDDLGRSFGIIFSPKFQHPTIFINHFHFFCKNIFQKNMNVKLFGHPLNPRALGTPLDARAPYSIQDSLNESSVRPNGTPVMPILRSRKTQFLFSSFCFDF